MTVLVILFFTIIIFSEVVPLYKKNHWKDFWTHSVILLFALITALLLSIGVEVPSPAKPIESIVKALTGSK